MLFIGHRLQFLLLILPSPDFRQSVYVRYEYVRTVSFVWQSSVSGIGQSAGAGGAGRGIGKQAP